jgi:RNA polymerase sigma-70 factor (ECF subfamily)
VTDHPSACAAAEAAARRSYGRLLAGLAARTRDLAAAEDALAEAFAAALADWPRIGIPASPEAWLTTVARRRLIDHQRGARRRAEAVDHLRLMAEELDAEARSGPTFPDRRLGLMFACAHPAIDPQIRAPLILQTILGFDAATIASAFLVSPTAMGQRLVRAKGKIALARIPLAVPERAELPERLDAVLAAVYAAFSEGWGEPIGAETQRRAFAEEALWLGRLVVSLLPGEPEALGLLALMLHVEARRPARRGADGAFVPLDAQDPKCWDGAMIEEAEALLAEASRHGVFGRYQLEAAVQSAHAVRRKTGRADWAAIERFYGVLFALTESPVVAINRAVAIAETRGVPEALAALEPLATDERLACYQPLWAVLADLRARAGRAEARDAYVRAIGLERDPAVRRFLQSRAEALARRLTRPA